MKEILIGLTLIQLFGWAAVAAILASLGLLFWDAVQAVRGTGRYAKKNSKADGSGSGSS